MEEEFNTSGKFNRFNFQAKMENRIRSISVPDTDQNTLLKPVENTIGLTFGNEIYDNLEKLRKLATVTGSFLPREMLAAAQLTENFNILNQFSCDCNILTGETIEWMLKSEIRSVTYKSLQQEGKLLEHVNLAPAFRDEFGRLLFQFLLNAKEIIPGNMLSSELLELSNVLSSIGEIEGDIGQKVKQILQSRSVLDDYYQVPENFIGRENELNALTDFVENNNYRGRWSGYLLHGQGGSGKSTLLAKFCRKVIEKNSALICVLDFDRPGINADDDIWMLNEFARQIATQSTDHTIIPDKFRIIEESENYGGQASGHLPEYRSMRSQSLPNIAQIKDILTAHAQKPILVVLDTIEQVLLHQNWISLQIWLDRLCDILSPTPVKVILSGRIYESIVSNNIEVRVDLADFDRKTAIEFLSRHGISRVDILKLLKYDLIPLRPLELRLIARILNQGQLNLEELIDDIQNGNGSSLGGEYFMGSVYRRILHRIEDTLLRKIAYPGLILRYVNADIVINVLAPTLSLGDISMKEAQTIVKELEKYVWLAYGDANGKVWHRRDLRQIMINLMISRESDQVQRIQLEAIRYFRDRGSKEDLAEALYHRMMMDNGKLDFIPELHELESAIEFFNRDLTDLPKGYSAMIHYASTGEIELNQIKGLPRTYFIDAYHTLGRNLVATNLMDKAHELYRIGKRTGVKGSQKLESFLDNWEMEVLFHNGNFNEIIKIEDKKTTTVRPDTALSLTNYLFPNALIYKKSIDRELLRSVLFSIPSDIQKWEREFNGPEGLSMINRITCSLVMLHFKQEFSEIEKIGIEHLYYAISSNRKTTIAIENSLFQLSLLSGKRLPEIYRYDTGTMNLSLDWLDEIEVFGDGNSDAISEIKAIISQSANQRLPARQILDIIDSDTKIRRDETRLFLNTNSLPSTRYGRFIDGPEILLRATCKSVIYQAIQDGMPPSILRNAAYKNLSIQITDIEKEIFKRRKRDAVDWMDPVIELIDRQWCLPEFMATICEEWQNSKRLNEVNRILWEWLNAKTFLLRKK